LNYTNKIEFLKFEDYIDRYINWSGDNYIETNNWMNFDHKWKRHRDFDSFMKKTANSVGLNDYPLLLTGLSKKILDNLFPGGDETDEIGEYADDLRLASKIYFFKIKNKFCVFEYDNRGSNLRLENDTSKEEYEIIMRILFKHIADNNPEFIDIIKQYPKYRIDENFDWDEDDFDFEEENENENIIPLNSEEYFEDYMNGVYNTTTYMNYMNDFDFNHWNEALNDIVTKVTGHEPPVRRRTVGTLFSYMLHGLEKNTLDEFLNGYETDELGEGADDLELTSKVYFFKLFGHLCVFHYDHRGSQVELERGLDFDTYMKIMYHIVKFIYDKDKNRIQYYINNILNR